MKMKKILLLLSLVFTLAFNLAAEEGEWFAGKMPETLINASGKSIDTAQALKGKIVAFYFSASWCGPCRGFTPTLVKFYKQVAKKKNVEIVFISSDKTEKDMKAYMKKMPWLAVPFNAQARNAFKKEMQVRGIPTLIVFDENGKIISKNARWDVVILGNKAVDAWKSSDYTPKTYNDYKSKASGKKSKSKKKNKR